MSRDKDVWVNAKKVKLEGRQRKQNEGKKKRWTGRNRNKKPKRHTESRAQTRETGGTGSSISIKASLPLCAGKRAWIRRPGCLHIV